MPQDVLVEIGQIAVSGAYVAAGAIPVGVIAATMTWRSGRRLLPRWSVPMPPKVGGNLSTSVADVGYLLLICFLFVANPLLIGVGSGILSALGVIDSPPRPDADLNDPIVQLRMAAGSVISAPILLMVWLWFRRRTRENYQPLTVPELTRQVALGVAAWIVVTPIVLGINFLTIWVAQQAGASPDEHPFSRLTSGLTTTERLLFGLIVCFFTPLAEEVLFRGLFIGWIGGRWYRPWAVLALAGLIVLSAGVGLEMKPGPLVFLALLIAGHYAIQRFGPMRARFPTRTVTSIYATAVLFAVAHSRIWPSPIPLFVLGLALGYLATRTNRIAACVVLHGLFNAVSYIFVLRGGSG